LTVNVWPAIVTAPLRGNVSAFAVHDTTTLPPPVPEARSIVTHGTPGDAVHAQEAADAVTATDTDPAPAVAVCPVGARVNVQGAGGSAAACDTVTVRPAIVKVPVRGDVVVLASDANVTLPSPEPDAPAVT